MAREREDLFSGMTKHEPNKGSMCLMEHHLGGDAIAITGQLATDMERVISVWNGSPKLPDDLRRQLLNLSRAIGQLSGESPGQSGEALLRLGLSERVPGDHNDRVRPVDPQTLQFFNLIDTALNYSVMNGAFQFLSPSPAGDPDLVDPRFVYIVRAGQAVGNEILEPSLQFESGHLHPDVRFFTDGGPLDVQFDAIATREPTDPISGADDLMRYFGGDSTDYAVIQIKLFTYPRYDDESRLTTIIPQFHREFRNQLASVILEFVEQGKYFTVPRDAYFVYLRPTAPTVIHQLKLTSSYLKTWSLQMELKLQEMVKNGAPEDEIRNRIVVQRFIDEEADVREILEHRLSPDEQAESLAVWQAVTGFSQAWLFEMQSGDGHFPKQERRVVRRRKRVFDYTQGLLIP